eukprot:6214444-Pleurochrysis_carterae.AAC.4
MQPHPLAQNAAASSQSEAGDSSGAHCTGDAAPCGARPPCCRSPPLYLAPCPPACPERSRRHQCPPMSML